MTTPALNARGLSVSLSGRPVVSGVDLSIGRGEFVALLGANGSGKTTLVRACVGLLPTTAGNVALFGTSLGSFTRWDRVGYVPQRSGASSGVPATVAEVVATGRLARRRLLGWPTASDRCAVLQRLEQVGLADRARDPVALLSGGQQQRVLIARALVADPRLLVLDEPVAGVDAASQQVLTQVFSELIAADGAVLLVAHELGPLAPLVDRVVALRDGRVAYDGPPTTLPDDVVDGIPGGHHAHSSQPARHGGLSSEGPWH